jgi:hypothetical protein
LTQGVRSYWDKSQIDRSTIIDDRRSHMDIIVITSSRLGVRFIFGPSAEVGGETPLLSLVTAGRAEVR